MTGPAIARAVVAGHDAIARALVDLDDDALRAPSLLPEWSRLTVLCHLRYGARAIDRMVRAAVNAEPALFYPEGRAQQRPGTLVPNAGESPRDVVASFVVDSAALDATLASLSDDDWARELHEPEGAVDIGTQTVEQLAALRLTEVEVHGGDLLLGNDTWSDTFVEHGLPLRFERLAHRLANQPPIDFGLEGTWLLRTLDGEAWAITLAPDRAEVRAADYDTSSDATITASRRDMLAFLLGRPLETEVVYAGDVELAAAFRKVFPGP
ncbi:MAG TPA: maleylpyruvate isomerase N-terminal domain-containing protein [Acidimicrobiales bacterium]|nr:maleylpyruvate isomerase N-terminal domain-containing protein [Acidimicrobiales bacterium]